MGEVAKLVAEVPLAGRIAQGNNAFSIQVPEGAPETFDGSLCSVRCVLNVSLDVALGSDVHAEQPLRISAGPPLINEPPTFKADKSSYAVKSVSEPAYQPEFTEQPSAKITCQNCGITIRTPNPKYCPSCGSRLDTQKRETAPPPVVQPKIKMKSHQAATPARVEDCMVCGRELGQNEDVVWCPHCGKLAHRNHLVEWIQSKGTCPSCGQKLDERQYE